MLPVAIAVLLYSVNAAPAVAQESADCTDPVRLSVQAAYDGDTASRKISLTFSVEAPCEPDREHAIYVFERPAGVPAECPRAASRPTASLTAPAGERSTVTLVVEPLYSTIYSYGIAGQHYSSAGPQITVSPRSPAPSPPPPTIGSDQVKLIDGRYVRSVVSGQPVTITVSGSDCTVDLLARTAREQGDRIIRTQTPDTGTATIRFQIRPTDNTVVWGQSRDTTMVNGGNTGPIFIQVRRAVSLNAQRLGVRRYVFSGRVAPATAGVAISLYRFDASGRKVLTARGLTDSTGAYRIDRVFSGSGGFSFQAASGADEIAAAGESPQRLLAIR